MASCSARSAASMRAPRSAGPFMAAFQRPSASVQDRKLRSSQWRRRVAPGSGSASRRIRWAVVRNPGRSWEAAASSSSSVASGATEAASDTRVACSVDSSPPAMAARTLGCSVSWREVRRRRRAVPVPVPMRSASSTAAERWPVCRWTRASSTRRARTVTSPSTSRDACASPRRTSRTSSSAIASGAVPAASACRSATNDDTTVRGSVEAGRAGICMDTSLPPTPPESTSSRWSARFRTPRQVCRTTTVAGVAHEGS